MRVRRVVFSSVAFCTILYILLAYGSDNSDVLPKQDALQNTGEKTKKKKNIRYFTTKASKGNIAKMGFQYQQKLPQVLGIGVKKCGTTALFRFLDIHPDFVLPSKPELHFFDRDYMKGLEYYRHKMPFIAPHEVSAEKSPRYFVLPKVPQRVKQANPNMKLLLVVCDPVKRLYSDYNFESHRKSKNLLKLQKKDSFYKNFDEFAAAMLTEIKKYPNSSQHAFEKAVLNSWSVSTYYMTLLNAGLYSVFLKNWLRHFPINQIMIINGDMLLTRPVEVVKHVQNFLNLSQKVDERDIVFDDGKGYYCINKYRRGDTLQCMGEAKGTTRNRALSDLMSSNTLESLKQFYRPFNQKFFRMIGRNFSWS